MILGPETKNDSVKEKNNSLSELLGANQSGDSHKRHSSLLPCLVDKLGTFTNVPDQDVVKQDEFKEDEQDIAMYFIGKGYCKVRVRDQNGVEK